MRRLIQKIAGFFMVRSSWKIWIAIWDWGFADDEICECFHRAGDHREFMWFPDSTGCSITPCDCTLFTERETFNKNLKNIEPRQYEFEPWEYVRRSNDREH